VAWIEQGRELLGGSGTWVFAATSVREFLGALKKEEEIGSSLRSAGLQKTILEGRIAFLLSEREKRKNFG